MPRFVKIVLIAGFLSLGFTTSVADATLKPTPPQPIVVSIVEDQAITLQVCYSESDSTYFLRGYVAYCDSTQFKLMGIVLCGVDQVQHPFTPMAYGIDTAYVDSSPCYRERFAGSINGGLLRRMVTYPGEINLLIFGQGYGISVKLDYGARKAMAKAFGWSELI